MSAYPPITLKVKVQTPDIRKLLTSFGMRRVLRAIGMRFRDITQANFGVAGAHRPTQWPPYARDYPKWGKRKGGPATLIQTGKLRGSFVVDSNHNDYVEISAEGIPYADAHQFGSKRVPARPYFPILSKGFNATLTPFAQRELEQAAEQELSQMLSRK